MNADEEVWSLGQKSQVGWLGLMAYQPLLVI